MRVELSASDGKGECSAGLERKRKGEGIWAGPGTQHLAVDSEARLVLTMLGQLS